MRMIDCDIIGCKYLKTTCAICGRTVDEKALPKPREWINVKDQPIPKDIPVIIWDGSDQFIVIWENDIDDWVADCGCRGWEYQRIKIRPTHWMLRPEPPK
jgi:hypothetical protein